MNPQDTHEQLHGDLYNSNEWKVKQITKVIKPSNTLRDCPKDYSIYFLNKKKKLKVCGESIDVRGLIRIPKDNIEIESDRYKEGKVKVNETKNSIEFDGFSDPYMPGANFLRCLRNAATKWKLGKDVLRSVVVTNDPLIEYQGSKDALEMYTKDQSYFSNTAFTSRGVWVQRLLFPDWKCTFELMVDDEILSVSQLNRIITMAGKAEGLGTWRPRFGRFSASELVEMAE